MLAPASTTAVLVNITCWCGCRLSAADSVTVIVRRAAAALRYIYACSPAGCRAGRQWHYRKLRTMPEFYMEGREKGKLNQSSVPDVPAQGTFCYSLPSEASHNMEGVHAVKYFSAFSNIIIPPC